MERFMRFFGSLQGRQKKMEKHREIYRPQDRDLVLQWGNRKRMRCVKVQVKSGMEVKVKRTAFRVERRIVKGEKEAPESPETPPSNPNCTQPVRGLKRALHSQSVVVKSMAAEGVKVGNNSGHSSPEKNERIHTRLYDNNNKFNGSSSTEETNKIFTDADTLPEKGCNLEMFVWPKVVIALSTREKEEDFIAIKGSKLPQRPKKRAKFIQKNLLVVSPGSWLCDLSQERYEVREKKNNKKRPR
ncbi:hypothetical protein KI387_014742, partial [Taxus chinensis]